MMSPAAAKVGAAYSYEGYMYRLNRNRKATAILSACLRDFQEYWTEHLDVVFKRRIFLCAPAVEGQVVQQGLQQHDQQVERCATGQNSRPRSAE